MARKTRTIAIRLPVEKHQALQDFLAGKMTISQYATSLLMNVADACQQHGEKEGPGSDPASQAWAYGSHRGQESGTK